jgi:hypothetical protein
VKPQPLPNSRIYCSHPDLLLRQVQDTKDQTGDRGRLQTEKISGEVSRAPSDDTKSRHGCAGFATR